MLFSIQCHEGMPDQMSSSLFSEDFISLSDHYSQLWLHQIRRLRVVLWDIVVKFASFVDEIIVFHWSFLPLEETAAWRTNATAVTYFSNFELSKSFLSLSWDFTCVCSAKVILLSELVFDLLTTEQIKLFRVILSLYRRQKLWIVFRIEW